MPAQNLPSLQPASEITAGNLPNGIRYYLVNNSISKGLADVAIVRKSGDVSSARGALSSLPHFGVRPPYRFLAGNGVDYGKDGYVSSTPISTTFRFRNVPMTDKSMIDSTLMLSFDIIDQSQADQAIIISGDFNMNTVLEEMKLFSMTISQREGVNTPYLYKWQPADTMTYVCKRPVSPLVSTISVRYEAPRTPAGQMNTMQPVISRMFSEELGFIVKNRLIKELRTVEIPVPMVGFEYVGSSEAAGNETYSFSVDTDNPNVYDATSVLSSILAAVDTKGVSLDEYVDARNEYVSNFLSADRKMPTNADYIRKCVSSFLYGASLASETTQAKFVYSRNLPDTTELRLFNNFSGALLDKRKNMTLQISAPSSVNADSLKHIFNSAWDKQAADNTDYAYLVNKGDTLGLAKRPFRSKITNVKAETISGGEIWKFSNGIRVIYKKTASTGVFDYAFMVRGGVDNVPGLSRGEGAFMSDMLGLFDVAGLTYYDFHNMLRSNGISMKDSVTLSDLRITGNAPSGKLSLLVKSLLAIANDRTVNPKAFEYYKAGEKLRLSMEKGSPSYRYAVIDSMMHSGDNLLMTKLPGNLDDSLFAKAGRYFDSQFSKVNDGVIVLMGDLDPKRVKTILSRNLGWFKTEKNLRLESQAQQHIGSGATTYTRSGENRSVDIVMKAPIQYTSENYYAAELSGYAIRKALVSSLAEVGMCVETYGVFNVWPQDSYTLRITCFPADTSSLPESVSPADMFETLKIVRSTINALSDGYLHNKELSTYKAYFGNVLSTRTTSVAYQVSCILTRLAEGKDLYVKANEKVNAVSPEKVKEVISSLNEGEKIEYVVQ